MRLFFKVLLRRTPNPKPTPTPSPTPRPRPRRAGALALPEWRGEVGTRCTPDNPCTVTSTFARGPRGRGTIYK
jgi:hypothetical protein